MLSVQIPVQRVNGKCGASPRGAGHLQSQRRGKARTVLQAEARQGRHVALPAAERSLHRDCPPRTADVRGQGRRTAPGFRGVGRVLPLVNWVDAQSDPTLAHELIIFIRVHNILPRKSVLFSTPSTKRLIMKLKSLVINSSKDTVFRDTEGLSLEQRSREG